MEKFFNAFSKALAVILWLIIMLVMAIMDMLQIDALIDNEITWLGYTVVSGIYALICWIAKRINLDGDLDDLDFD